VKFRDFLLLILLFLPVSAHANKFGDPIRDGDWIKNKFSKPKIQVVIDDRSLDECWTNVEEVREYIKERLVKIGIGLFEIEKDEGVPTLEILLFVRGMKRLGHCIGYSTIHLRNDWINLPNENFIVVYASRDKLLSSQQNNFNEKLLDLVDSIFMEELHLDIE